jgi:hypothetical protein
LAIRRHLARTVASAGYAWCYRSSARTTRAFKLTAALYAGFLICAIGCLMHVTATTFAPRITLLAASLFAIVVNMRVASQALGSEHGITLVDELHISGLAYIVLVTAVTLLVRVRSEWQADPAALIRLDNRCCLAAAFLFMIFNLLLLGQGTIKG